MPRAKTNRPLADPADTSLVLFHATSRAHLAEIVRDGLRPGAYFAIRPVADYYASVIDDEGEEAVVLSVPLSSLAVHLCSVDEAGVAEPITTIIGRSEDDVQALWKKAKGGWEDSLRVIGSLRYMGRVPTAALRLDGRPLSNAVRPTGRSL
jgi:hypothetical protein